MLKNISISASAFLGFAILLVSFSNESFANRPMGACPNSGQKLLAAVSENGNTGREIIYCRQGNTLTFYLAEQGATNPLKSLSVRQTVDEIEIQSSKGTYKFDLFKSMTHATGKAYAWCWTAVGDQAPPAMYGVVLLGVGIVGSAVLCATVPAAPFLLGLAALPVDGVITVADSLFNVDRRAGHKLRNMIHGKSVKANANAFAQIIEKVKEL